MGELCQNELYRDLFTVQLNNVAGFLEQNPSYSGIDQLEIDLNLIEVSVLISLIINILHFIAVDTTIIN